MNQLLTILLQDANEGGFLQNSGGLIMIVAMIAIFYFFMIRPQNKKQKEIRKAREALGVGDKVVTAGGIYGKIKEIGETTFIVEISAGVTIRIEKTSVYPAPQPSDNPKK